MSRNSPRQSASPTADAGPPSLAVSAEMDLELSPPALSIRNVGGRSTANAGMGPAAPVDGMETSSAGAFAKRSATAQELVSAGSITWDRT